MRFIDSELTKQGDRPFLEKWRVHPMVALFINLPKDKEPQWIEILTGLGEFDLRISVEGTMYKPYERTAKKTNIPYGTYARRTLLYFFAGCYQNPNFEFLMQYRNLSINKALGYNTKNFRIKDPVLQNFIKILNLHCSYVRPEDNESAGYVKVSERQKTTMFLGRGDDYLRRERGMANAGYRDCVITVHPKFMFNTAFPVDFSQVTKVKRRCEFWNIYLFLVDVMPRIKEPLEIHYKWGDLQRLFGNGYRSSLANFKSNFLKLLYEVIEIYPQADGQFHFDSKFLILRYAPPPV